MEYNITLTKESKEVKDPKEIKKTTFFNNLMSFLNSKTGTILSSAIGMSIGLAFQDFVSAFVRNVIQPLLISVIVMTRIDNYYDFKSLISPQNNVLNISTFISTFITFFLIVTILYYVNVYTVVPIV